MGGSALRREWAEEAEQIEPPEDAEAPSLLGVQPASKGPMGENGLGETPEMTTWSAPVGVAVLVIHCCITHHPKIVLGSQILWVRVSDRP